MFLKLFPVIFSSVLFAAHLSRSGYDEIAIFVLFFPLLLLIKKSWVMKFFQIFLIIAGIEWLHRTWTLVQERIVEGRPYQAALIILLLVAVFTFGSLLTFRDEAVKQRYS
jgi:hypothetical protein